VNPPRWMYTKAPDGVLVGGWCVLADRQRPVWAGRHEGLDGADLRPRPFSEHPVTATALRNRHISAEGRTFGSHPPEFGVKCAATHRCGDVGLIIDRHGRFPAWLT
jgi:hypothetical protein